MKPSFALIGPGRVGTAVSRLLVRAGYRLTTVIGRDLIRVRAACRFIGCDETLATTDLARATGAQLILIAVADDAIRTVAGELQQRSKFPPRTILLHFSGVHPAAIMGIQSSTAYLGSIHPLLPFAAGESAVARLPGAFFTVEGDNTAITAATEIVLALGGRSRIIASEHKHLYHAAACMASNSLVTLVAEARNLLKQCRIDEDDTVAMLMPLLEATLENLRHQGVDKGLTGPIVRGDTATVELHIKALENMSDQTLALYCLMGQQTALQAEKSGRLPADGAAKIIDLLKKCQSRR